MKIWYANPSKSPQMIELEQKAASQSCLFRHIPLAMTLAEEDQRNRSYGQLTFDTDDLESPKMEINEVDLNYGVVRMLQDEMEVLGFCISGSLAEVMAPQIEKFTSHELAEAKDLPEGTLVRVAGMIQERTISYTHSGNRFVRFQIQGPENLMNCVMWSPLTYEAMVSDGQVRLVDGRIDSWNDKKQLVVHRVMDLNQAQELLSKACLIITRPGLHNEEIKERLSKVFKGVAGLAPVWIVLLDFPKTKKRPIVIKSERLKANPHLVVKHRLWEQLQPFEIAFIADNEPLEMT